MALTDRKSLFAQAIVDSDGKISNANAAIRAGYSAKTAFAAGSRLAKDKDVLEHVEYLKGQREASGNTVNDAGIHTDVVAQKGSVEAQGEGAETEDLSDPKTFLQKVMTGELRANKMQVEAAKALIPYEHAKIAQQGKKEALQDAAYGAGNGFFRPLSAPKPVQADLWSTDKPQYAN